MENLDEIADMIEAELNEKDTLREIALKSARAIIRLSGAAVRSMHKGEDPSVLLDEARDEASRLRGLLLDHPDLYSAGFVEDAMQEFTEAVVLRHIVENRELPTPSEIDVSSTAYLLGLGTLWGSCAALPWTASARETWAPPCSGWSRWRPYTTPSCGSTIPLPWWLSGGNRTYPAPS